MAKRMLLRAQTSEELQLLLEKRKNQMELLSKSNFKNELDLDSWRIVMAEINSEIAAMLAYEYKFNDLEWRDE